MRAIESGGTVITASRRLARVLAREFHALQAERGRAVWNRPDVLPLGAFLDRAWREWLSRWADGRAPVLLSEFQEQALWEQIIRQSPEGATLLQIPETALQAGESRRLVVEYRLPVDGRFEAAEDWATFARWSREFERRCRANGWMERARLGDFLREKIAAGELARPEAVFAAGFDQITPLQSDFLEAAGARVVEPDRHERSPERRKFVDSTQEIRGAAAWARRLLELDPAAQIGVVVVPDLMRERAKIERIFGEALAPGLDATGRGRVFHISLGPALDQYPAVHAALLMLEFAQGGLQLPRAGMLLRSPFARGAEKEWGRRAQLDAKLRKNGVWDISLAGLREEAGSCPELQRTLRRVEKQLGKTAALEEPSGWSASIQDLLDAFGWPGDRTPTSGEFQAIARWHELVASLAGLDLVAPTMNFAQAIDWLGREAANTRFQAEDEGAPVQVMGMLEAAGLRFDHLWILGLDDEALPMPANPNPFLPVSLQREHGLPHSSAEGELEFAAALISRLIESAPDVVLSYPATEGDRALAPSPVVSGGMWLEAEETDAVDWMGRMRASAVFEELADERAPVVAEGNSTGGARLFKDMAACPFRAFAVHRLGAWPLEEAELGLSYRDRGTTVHKALEVIWREVGTQARLLSMGQDELGALIAHAADEAVAKIATRLGRNLEKPRLKRLLAKWLEIEKARPEFSVAGIEAERVAEIGGIAVKVRADRVDTLPDGRQIILDYKTGQVKARGWEGERLDEPQLPLYCATSEGTVGGAAFAVIRSDDMLFRGLTAEGVALPEFKKMAADASVPFDLQLMAWRRALEQLGENFRAGDAAVDPKPGACDHCGLEALCRIREREDDRG